MRMIFLGSGAFGCASLKWLARSDHQVLEVVTQPARPAGRGRKIQPTPVAELSKQLNLPCRGSSDVNEPGFTEYLRRLQPEVLLVIAFGQKIGPALLNLPGCRIINLHGSLLPKYRGAAPINWAIINGEPQTGLTIIELNEIWDGGDMLGQLATDIKPQETAGELHDRLTLLGPKLLNEVLDKIARGTDTPLPQDETLACRAPKLCKADGAIRWNQPARRIRNFIHGMWPWPGAVCYLQQARKAKTERLSIARAQVIPETYQSVHPESTTRLGEVAEDMNIICASSRLHLTQVRPENGKIMDYTDFVNGRHIQPGDRFLDG